MNVTKEERSNLTLFCNAIGNPAPIIFWTKDGSSLSNSSRIRFSKHNRLLTISNLNRKDSGHYRCVANNSLGNDTSNVTIVDIQCKFSSHYCTGMNSVLIHCVDCQQISCFSLQFTLFFVSAKVNFCYNYCLINMAFE